MQPPAKDTIFEIFPVLHTKRLKLVEIKAQHVKDLFNLFGNSNVTEFYNVVTLTKEKEAEKFIEHFSNRYMQKAAIRWGITLEGHDEVIGTIGFNNFTRHHRANIGYDLLPLFWNKGYATEALMAVISFGFNRLEINRIEAEVMQGNASSERVLEKVGFKKEGVLREWMYWNEKYYNMTMFSLLKAEFS